MVTRLFPGVEQRGDSGDASHVPTGGQALDRGAQRRAALSLAMCLVGMP